jgi:RimJ/RimL family protein N-acetyltransferase
VTGNWPAAEAIDTPRLRLVPLSPDDAAEMVRVLADPALYLFTGGTPPSEADLRGRYTVQAAGSSPDGSQGWLNWIVRDRRTGRAAGYLQATVTDAAVGNTAGGNTADLAWVVGTGSQGRGIAAEAASAMLDWLRAHGVGAVTAHIHPGHRASARVAERLGLAPTAVVVDGEVRWSLRT